jgi:MoxR-like ATPase
MRTTAPHETRAVPGVQAPPEQAGELLALIVDRVRLRARRRLAWLRHLEGNGGRDGSIVAGWAAALDGNDRPEAEVRWFEQAPELRQLNEDITAIEAELAGPAARELQRLELLFRLNREESDLLQACVALHVDPSLGALYGALQHDGNRRWVTDALAARLFGSGRRAVWNASSPLATWGWVKAVPAPPGEPAVLDSDPIARDWLQGGTTIDAELLDAVAWLEPHEPLDSWPVAELEARLRQAITGRTGVRLVLSGTPGSGRRTLAAVIARRIGLPALSVDVDRIADEDWPDAYVRCQRLALLFQAALVWHGSRLDRRWPAVVSPSPAQFVACEEGVGVPAMPDLIDYATPVPTPTLAERRALLDRLLPEAHTWPATERDRLVARYKPSVGQLAGLAARKPPGPGAAAALLRELTRHDLGDLGRLLDTPYGWDDLVLPAPLIAELEAFVAEAKQQASFWERAEVRRLFGRGRGLVGLLTGSPGTGKTMCAQVVAAELDLDLVRIDLATTVSKYIGETAKHLQRIFLRARRMNAVLFFDEADSLFTKRTEVRDAHDRYANMDTNYLLELVEDFDGIALLASNKRGNIDPAFARRMRYVLHLPRPAAEQRLEIWRRLIAELEGPSTLARAAPAIGVLADEQALSGAQIKGAILTAMFLAGADGAALTAEHLLRGVDRELGKEGRRVGTDLRDRLLQHNGSTARKEDRRA